MVEIGEWIPLLKTTKFPRASGLYIVRNIDSGKEYVGQSMNLWKRMTGHRSMQTDFYFHRALRKHGLERFEVCIWALAAREDLGRLEIALIESRGSFAPAGYNASRGGLGPIGTVWTPEAKEAARIRGKERMTPEMKAKLRAARPAENGWKGKKHTMESLKKIGEASTRNKKGITYGPEVRARMSAAQKGKKRSDEVKAHMGAAQAARYEIEQHVSSKEVAVWLPGCMVPRIFPSTIEAFQWAGIKSRTSIRNWCEGTQVPKNGWVWSFL